MTTLRGIVGLGSIGALLATGLVATPVAAGAGDQAGGLRAATARLLGDADGGLARGPGFVSVPAGVAIDNPAVTPRTPVPAAARAHLERYGAALGVDGDQLVASGVTHTVAGTDAVRFTQEVDGVPVIGGEVVVTVAADRELASAQATVSTHRKAAIPLVGEDAAAERARAVTARASGAPVGSLDVTGSGRWLLDPVALGAPERLGTHTVWRFEVGDGAGVRRTVLVDVRTGAVVANLDAIQHVDRVVCDRNNTAVASPPDCTTGFVRTESSGASAVADANQAFDYSGAVSTFYDEIGDVDLTDLIGLPVGGVKKLTSTVRFCLTGQACPYANAFWNGTGMFYGAGYTAGDDVVGHEMTHGVIDRNSSLFYWGQSGAINESIADIMGEILDHRNPTAGDTPTDWRLGEDLPIGAIRDLADPPDFGQPDSTTSGLYTADLSYNDSGGVHQNSGVGNKTAYLISQGGTFNGQNVTGIDGGDAGLTKTATLYLLVLQTLSSGSDYADLALVLDSACQQLVGGPSGIMTAANCNNVHKAGLATRLATTPTNAAQPPDAKLACPSGKVRVLFNSETGNPAAKFDAGPTWNRGAAPGWGSNATSGLDSWFSDDPATIGSSALETTSAISLPKGQKSYLWFQHWRLLDYDANGFYDGGTVEIDGEDTASRKWVNGPQEVLSSSFGNPAGGARSFGGDSLGYIASRLDLTPYAGTAIRPAFLLHSDVSVGYIGWFVDDVRVYTCDSIKNTKKPRVAGVPKVGNKLTARPGSWKPGKVRLSYAWLRNGKPIAGAKKKKYVLVAADKGKKVAVRVTARKAGFAPTKATSAAVGPVRR